MLANQTASHSLIKFVRFIKLTRAPIFFFGDQICINRPALLLRNQEVIVTVLIKSAEEEEVCEGAFSELRAHSFYLAIDNSTSKAPGLDRTHRWSLKGASDHQDTQCVDF